MLNFFCCYSKMSINMSIKIANLIGKNKKTKKARENINNLWLNSIN